MIALVALAAFACYLLIIAAGIVTALSEEANYYRSLWESEHGTPEDPAQLNTWLSEN